MARTRGVLRYLHGCRGEQPFGESIQGASKGQLLADTRYLGVSGLQSGDTFTLEHPSTCDDLGRGRARMLIFNDGHVDVAAEPNGRAPFIS